MVEIVMSLANLCVSIANVNRCQFQGHGGWHMFHVPENRSDGGGKAKPKQNSVHEVFMNTVLVL